ncbi:DNA helicase [Desulfosarcina ovata subsp. sediminis]|uniref:DNA 3'-5' helicase n=1 Tax=Desulfosarcina ovata subsp. sediminis TaxID=885957 RepID=A0A5K7ZUS7_9BACT|nr:UvrD-helicase domain-containing protein [Desulfosarcina ovata]BBO83992.1 DNA helicase [Desulfosarcina ovata subsp. sediminis]
MNSNTFIADLHIHSKFSRATAKDLDLENIYIWAQLKGITVVGTGDFTHPDWFAQIIDKLEPAEPGLYRLRSDIEKSCDPQVPVSCRAPVRFMLSCEISNIYKKQDRTRKNHNLVFFPDIEDVKRFNGRLDAIGNICSDGRPILGLDARDLLEITLETSENGFLVPAHIWTPWFSMLGSKSGFDTLSDCFEDLSHHIFAAETGLSSDPPMNWRVSDLDQVTLISNSDAHSPSKLGREANIFKTELSYHAMRRAMEKGDKDQFLGTFEFYPEEGKYHVDGHRKCEVCFSPAETLLHQGICPVCNKPLTLGVLHRVETLATRTEGVRPTRTFPFYRLIPLENLLSEIFRVGPKSKKVSQTYRVLLEKLGNEFNILHYLDTEKIESAGVPLLAEAISRMRDDRVSFSPGYDGLFGTVRIFSEAERSTVSGQRSLFATADKITDGVKPPTKKKISQPPNPLPDITPCSVKDHSIQLNPAQQAAVDFENRALMIVAGPGTGKTRTLTHKIGGIINAGVDARCVLAVTFTNKAATEMRERLRTMLGDSRSMPILGTFHALGYRILSQWQTDQPFSVIDEGHRRELVRDVLVLNGLTGKASPVKVDDLMGWIVAAKQKLLSSQDPLEDLCPPELVATFESCSQTYERLMDIDHLLDFEDLIFRTVQLLENESSVQDRYVNRFSDIFIDEYQDINAGQYRLVRRLAGDQARLCVIGDPDQSIYGFRGSDITCFNWFLKDYPGAEVVFLRRNYRSTQTILEVSSQVIRKNAEQLDTGHRRAVYSDHVGDRTIQVTEAQTENAEAVAIGKTIEAMIGGIGFFSMDSGAVDGSTQTGGLSFSDFAVLFRTRIQADPIRRMLEKAGIPCQVIDRQSVLDHPGIKGVVSIFRLIHGLGTFADIQMASDHLKPGISGKTVEKLKSWAYRNRLPIKEALIQSRRLPIPGMGISKQQQLYDFLNQISDWKQRVETLSLRSGLDMITEQSGILETVGDEPGFEKGFQHMMEAADAHRSDDAAGFLAALALCRDTDTYDHRVEKVSLSTMHASKGLEFSVVFIAGCEDGWIPYQSVNRPADLEEERRLFYVALTRAKRHLFLTRAKTRRINGQMQPRQLSPFVNDIENIYKEFSATGLNRPQPAIQKQLSLF